MKDNGLGLLVITVIVVFQLYNQKFVLNKPLELRKKLRLLRYYEDQGIILFIIVSSGLTICLVDCETPQVFAK